MEPNTASISPETTPMPQPKTPRKSGGNIPRKDADLIAVCASVYKAWKASPAITLAWTTPAEFETCLTQLESSYAQAKSSKGERSPVTQELAQLDKEIDESIAEVKNRLKSEFRKNAESYYPQLGIERAGAGWKLPSDRDKRVKALDQVLTGVAATGLDKTKVGTAYWTGVRDRYKTLKEQAKDKDSTTTRSVADKTQMTKLLKKTLNSLVRLITAQNPDNYRNELRAWGFQREKY